MNCYNGEKFLREALDSVVNQNYKNWELIFWDNQSTDHSAAIAQDYTDSRIKYFRAPLHTNLGLARKLAVEQTEGEFLAFLDTDDVYLPCMLEIQCEAIEKFQAAACYGGIHAINMAGEMQYTYIPKKRHGNLFPRLLRQFDIQVPTLLIRKSSLAEKNLTFDENIFGSEEYALLMQLAVDTDFAVSNVPLAKVRLRRGSLTYAVMDKWATERIYVLDRIRSQHPQKIRVYGSEFGEAYARANYYQARWLVENGRRTEALAELRKAVPVGFRYAILYIVLKLSMRSWHFIHRRLRSARG